MSSQAHADILRLPSRERGGSTGVPLRLVLVVALVALLAALASVAPLPILVPLVLIILDLASLNLLGRGCRVLMRRLAH